MENVEHFNFFGGLITNDEKHTYKIKTTKAVAKAPFNNKRLFFNQKNMDFNLREKLVNFYMCSITLCHAETWILQEVCRK